MKNEITNNIVWHHSQVTAEQRRARFFQRGCVLWFTGLSGSGKSTLAGGLEAFLVERGRFAYVLDGDNIRHGLNRDLGFSEQDRVENIRRIGEVAALFADAGIITATAFISPYRKDRELARNAIGPDRFIEVQMATSLEVCEARDPKGLYKKARSGEIAAFTGVSAPYEASLTPELCIDTGEQGVTESVQLLHDYLVRRGFLLPSRPSPDQG